jgi:hypothetical protein
MHFTLHGEKNTAVNAEQCSSLVVFIILNVVKCKRRFETLLSRLTSTGQRSATSPLARTVLSTRTQPSLCKGLPDITLVGTSGKCSVSVQDGIAGLNEVRTARLPTGKC